MQQTKDVTIPSPLQALLLLGWGEGWRPYVMRIWPHWSLRGQVTYSCIRWHPSAQKNRRRSGETPRPIIQTPTIDVLTDHSLEPWARYRDIPHPYRKNALPWEQTTCQWCCRLPGSRVYSARRGLWLRVALLPGFKRWELQNTSNTRQSHRLLPARSHYTGTSCPMSAAGIGHGVSLPTNQHKPE